MHYEYNKFGDDEHGYNYHIYEVDGDEQKFVLTMYGDDFKMWPLVEAWSKTLNRPPEEVFRMLKVKNRVHHAQCKECDFWDDERDHCAMKTLCHVARTLFKQPLILIEDLLEMVRYAEDSYKNGLRYATMDGEVGIPVHHDYFNCLAYLANHQEIIGGINIG